MIMLLVSDMYMKGLLHYIIAKNTSVFSLKCPGESSVHKE